MAKSKKDRYKRFMQEEAPVAKTMEQVEKLRERQEKRLQAIRDKAKSA